MKKLYLPICTLFLAAILSGCGSQFHRRNPTMAGSLAAKDQVVSVEREAAKNSEAKLEEVAVMAAGTKHALNKEPAPSKAVEVAKDLNDRVISLSGSPTIEELNRVYKLVDDLTSQMKLERERGLEELAKKDGEINKLQEETKAILVKKDLKIQNLMSIAEKNAAELDAANAELGKMNSFFGLGAVFYGLKRFIFSAAWILGGFGIVFIVLRVFAGSNPVVGALFSIFEVIASFFLNTIKGLVPGAIKFANLAPTAVVNQYKKLSEKIIDIFETLKDRDDAAAKNGGQPQQYTLPQILDLFSQRFGDDDKNLVKEIKQKLGW